jgi:hypothetical protein
MIEQQRTAKVQVLGADVDTRDTGNRRIDAGFLPAVQQLVERIAVAIQSQVETEGRIVVEIDGVRFAVAGVDLELTARSDSPRMASFRTAAGRPALPQAP